MPVVVRAALPEDAPGLADLKIEWGRMPEPPPAAERAEFARDLRRWMEGLGENLVVRVAVDDSLESTAVGMAWMVLFSRAPNFGDLNRLTADIQSVFVTPAYRGRGIGGQLVRGLCDDADARGIPRVLVSANELAAPLYRRSGFEPSSHLLERMGRTRAGGGDVGGMF